MPGSFYYRAVLAVALAVVPFGAVEAQSSSPASAPSPSPAPAHEPPPAAAQTGTPAVVVDLQAMDGLIGKSVKGQTGEDMGRLVDCLVGTNGEIRAAVIDFGGVLGVGSRKIAVDWHALNFADSAKGGPIKVMLTRDALRVAPELRSGEPVVILQGPKSVPPDQKPATGGGAETPAPRQ